MDNIVNVQESDYFETKIPLDELNAKSTIFDSSLNYSYGVLTMLSKAFACIKPAFFNNSYEEGIEYSPSEIVIFNPSNVALNGIDGKINTTKKMYLVRYRDGGIVNNPKTGDAQPTIDYSVPIEILFGSSKKQCIYMTIENDILVVKTIKVSDSNNKTQKNLEEKHFVEELDETAISILREKIIEDISNQGFSYASEIPQYLYEACGTKDIQQFAHNVREFINNYLPDLFTYESSFEYNNKTIPGVILPKREITEEKIDILKLFNSFGIKQENTDYRIGIVSYCAGKVAFINPGYDETVSEETNALSVIFNPTSIQTVPNNFIFHTKHNIYVVLFAVSGVVLNSKTGLEHPAIDQTVPVRIVKSIVRKDCLSISISTTEISIKYFQEKSFLDSALAALDEKISSRINASKFMLASDFPQIAKESGLLNFRKYADSIELFIEKFLKKYILVKNVAINQKSFPGVIVDRHNRDFIVKITSEKNGNDTANAISKSINSFDEFDALFSEKRYKEALSSVALKKISPQDLPVEYIEKVLTAADRLLFSNERDEIKLNSFQMELFNCSSSRDFIKKWKHNGTFSDNIIEGCCETSIADFVYPEDSTIIVKFLNAIGHKNTVNDNYTGILERFVSCENVLVPHLFLIRAFINNSSTSTQRTISEYCLFIKALKHSPSGGRLTDDFRLYGFKELMYAVNTCLSEIILLPRTVRTHIVAVCFEYCQIEMAKDIISLWDDTQQSTDGRIVNLYFAPNVWDEQYIVDLIKEGANIQLLQRCIAIIWSKYANEPVLPRKFLELLSWIVIDDDPTSIEEILRYPSSKKLNRIDKLNMLVNSFESICTFSYYDIRLFALASYIADEKENYQNLEAVAEPIKIKLRDWESFSDKIFKQACKKTNTLTYETERDYISLFSIFRLDTQHYLQLQAEYSNWFITTKLSTPLTEDEIKEVLNYLYDRKAYAALKDIYSQQNSLIVDDDSEKYAIQYVLSLAFLHKYSEAISFLNKTSIISIAQRNAFLPKILGENFRKNGLSHFAFSCFDDSFTCEEAINLLQSNLSLSQAYSVNSLVAIYIHKEEYVKAAYLYVIYSSKVDKGYFKLYYQCRAFLHDYLDFNRLKSPVHVIDFAFKVLSAEKLISFLDWANGIIVPDIKGNREPHIFQYFYERLVEDPRNKDNWIVFLNHLLKNGLEKNSWNILVCETVLRRVLNNDNRAFSESAITLLCNIGDKKAIPPAFLIYVFQFIEDTKNNNTCKCIIDMMSNDADYNFAVKDNSWLKIYSKEIGHFKTFCLSSYEETNNNLFNDLLVSLRFDLNIKELEGTIKASSSKRLLISKICKNYLEGNDLEETINLLNSPEWGNTSYSEMKAIALLKLVFDNENGLFVDAEDLFDNDETIYRFKYDCVNILKYYPEKKGLFLFNESCNNESYKMLVYTYIFNVIYDQDLYKVLDKKYTDFTSKKELDIYLHFLISSYKMQLVINTTFPSFYKKWRYLKLFLAHFLINPNCIYDSEISELMMGNGHYDEFFTLSYIPFTEYVREFWGLSDLSLDFKTRFLFALLIGDSNDVFENHIETFANLSQNEKDIFKQLIISLDYRDFNEKFYEFYWKDIKAKKFTECLTVAASISDYSFDAIQALSKKYDDVSIELFAKLALNKKHSRVLTEATLIDAETLHNYHSIIVPLLCSRQFIFYINDRFRSLVIRNKQNASFCQRYEYIAKYVVNTKKTNDVSAYLWALYYCIQKEREKAKLIVSDSNILASIPEKWKKEAQRIADYTNGETDRFSPDKSIVDGSEENKKSNTNTRFASTILGRKFTNEKALTTIEEASEAYEHYLSETDNWEKSKYGLLLLCFLSNEKSKRHQDLPSINDFSLELGLLIIKPDTGFSLNERFLVVAALFNNRATYSQSKYSSAYNELKSEFMGLININNSITVWVKYASVIEDFLRESKLLLDFHELKERILEKCSTLTSLDIAYEKKISEYEILLSSFSGLTSNYSTSVLKAIQEECKTLGNGVRLEIKIEDCNVSDGKIYFSIRNNSNRTVSLENDGILIILQQENQPDIDIDIESIRELQRFSLTGGCVQLVTSSDDVQTTVKISAYRINKDGLKELISCDCERISFVKSEQLFVPADSEYNVRSAVDEESMLFGREHQKDLLTKSIPKGVTLIYGPSRIGKTSLMNWIRNKLACDQGNVATIICGGENGLGKNSDYSRNLIDGHSPLPFDDDYGMSQYLLVDTIIHGLTRDGRDRLGKPAQKKLSRDLIENILQVLRDSGTNIKSKYYEINDFLEEEGIELWLMLDEFQQIVEKWQPNIWSDFVEVCNLLSSTERNKPQCIKLIICGSDDLLKHMTLKRDSVWKSAFRSTISVGALLPEPFKAMIEQDRAVADTNLRYSSMAIEALYNYTGGVALYGKEICNAILEDIKTNPQKYDSRTCIYAFDVAEATQRLLNRQTAELSTKAKEGISEIYAAVTKNLDEKTEMQMLWFMAKWLYENKKNNGFPESVFTNAMLSTNFAEHLNDSLRIAEARGILRQNHSQYSNENSFVFTTLFYFYAFFGSAKDNLDESLIFSQLDDFDVSNTFVSDLETVKQIFGNMDEESQEWAIGGMALSAKSPNIRKKLKEIAGKSYEGDDRSITVNSQNITNTINGIFAAGADFSQIVSNLQSLPRLNAYLGESGIPLLEDLESENPELVVEAETNLESTTSQMVSDYLSALVSNNDTPDEFCVWDMLRITKGTYMDISKKILPSFMADLFFAAKLDYIFELAKSDESEIDCSPVCIMYCKTLEKVLRFYHTEKYQEYFPENSCEKDYLFGDLTTMSERDRKEIQSRIQLGSFLFPIKPGKYKEDTDWINVPKSKRSDWRKHGQLLKNVVPIRNKSAHGNSNGNIVGKAQLEKLKKLLFSDDGILNIIVLSEDD